MPAPQNKSARQSKLGVNPRRVVRSARGDVAAAPRRRQSGVGTPSEQTGEPRARALPPPRLPAPPYRELSPPNRYAVIMRGITAQELTRNSILRINEKKTMQLLHEYKKEDCLWNSSMDDYPNKEKRVRAAQKIAKILNIKNFEGQHVLIKIKNLRNSYSQELKKIKESIDTLGPDSPDLYRPKVQWFSLMDSFLRPHVQTSKLLPNPTESNTSVEVYPDVKTEYFEIDESDEWSQQQESAAGASYQSEGHSEPDDQSNDSQYQQAKRRRMSSSAPSENMSQHQVFLPSSVSTAAARPDDTYDNFGKYVASLLRGLPAQDALRVQPRIIDMIVNVGVKQESGQITVHIDRVTPNGEVD
ncbi:hypothetical protein SFRURICE_018055 [Spodoptera frugiperda]|uniref:SFRICE_039107 n=1 Tax=Spodoptera frugiperda TaxID=7108 RepID=A0A2H1X021_SPOFR|nr:hypothetical protein SFRURICE_018055 [Spodoptera frugiperda]